jgi:hypothetical protein
MADALQAFKSCGFSDQTYSLDDLKVLHLEPSLSF